MAEPITKELGKVLGGANITPSTEESVASSKKDSAIVALNYPAQMPAQHMIIKFYEYEYSAAVAGKAKYGPKCSIAMPLPQNFIESSRLNVGGSQLGILGAMTTDILGGAIGGDVAANIKTDIATADATKLKEVFGNSFAGGIAAGADATVFITKALAGKISPQIGQGISASAGSAMNNQTTLIFDGVDLKIHNFEWLFSPKNAEDQKKLDEIIQTINYFIHPDYKSPVRGLDSKTLSRTISRGLLTYPALMTIELMGVSGGMNFVFRTNKFLMVNQFNVDYSASGGIVLNKGGNASVIRCSMNTTESEIRTRADYRKGLPGSLGEDSATATPSEQQDGAGITVGDIAKGLLPEPGTEQAGGNPIDNNKKDDASTEDTAINDQTPAYRVLSSNNKSKKKYDIFNASGKKLRGDVLRAAGIPDKSAFFANPPVDR